MTTMQTGSKGGSSGAAAPVSARFEPRASGQPGPRCRVLVKGAGGNEIDVSCNITGAIAHALWQVRGGDSVSNWCDAEQVLDQLAGMSGLSGMTGPKGTSGMSGGTQSGQSSPMRDGESRQRAGTPEIVVGGRKKFNRQ
jgi:hypothetical protein